MAKNSSSEKSISYLGNPNLKKSDVPISFTKEQVAEYIKCAKDPIYFIENYVKIISVDEGLINFKLYDYQKKYVDMLMNNRFVISRWCRQSGKCQSYYTNLKVRNKKTGEVIEIPIGKFFEMIDNADKVE